LYCIVLYCIEIFKVA